MCRSRLLSIWLYFWTQDLWIVTADAEGADGSKGEKFGRRGRPQDMTMGMALSSSASQRASTTADAEEASPSRKWCFVNSANGYPAWFHKQHPAFTNKTCITPLATRRDKTPSFCSLFVFVFCFFLHHLINKLLGSGSFFVAVFLISRFCTWLACIFLGIVFWSHIDGHAGSRFHLRFRDIAATCWQELMKKLMLCYCLGCPLNLDMNLLLFQAASIAQVRRALGFWCRYYTLFPCHSSAAWTL